MKIKQSISVLLSAVTLLSVSVGIGGNSKLPSFFEPAAISVQASDYVWTGGYGGKFSIQVGEDAYLYLAYTDDQKSAAKVVGSGLGIANTSIQIPDSAVFHGVSYNITEIADGAFEGQTNLGSVNGCRNIERIGNKAFSGCTGLSYFNVSAFDKSGKNKLKTIGDEAFLGCAELTSSIIPSVENNTIGSRAFAGCNKLSYIILMDTSFIGASAYEGCYNVSGIDLGHTNLTEIYENTFYDCNLAKEIILPDTLVKIGDYAFARCQRFKEIYIPDSVTSIGKNAFRSCRELQMVMMSENIQTIDDYAFYACDVMNYFVCKNPAATIGKEAVGYDYNRFYTGKKKNFTVWGNGGKTKEYADSLGFTYHNCSEAPSLATKKVKDCVWKATNIEENWSGDDGNYYYNDYHKQFINSYEYGNKWGGSCYGLAATSMLVYNDLIEVEDFCLDYPTINSIPNGKVPDFTKSFVNTVWANQGNTYDRFISSFGDIKNRSIRKIEYLTYAQKSAVLTYVKEILTPGHAILCFGLEFKENASDKDTNAQWKNMNARIMVTDNNYSYFQPYDYIYINTETSDWGYGKLLGAGAKVIDKFQCNPTKTPNATFELNYDFIDVYDYIMDNPVKITEQPESVKTVSGSKTTVKVSATGDGLKYQWYYCNPGKTEFLASSVKKAEYTTTMTASNSGRKIYCVITDKYGNSVKTDTVELSIKKELKITAQPVNANAAIGSVVKTSVTATGDGLKYQWYYCNPGKTEFLASSVKKAGYSTTMTASNSGRQIYCEITDVYGNKVKTNIVTITSKVAITKQPTNVSATIGNVAETSVTATGNGLTYKWYYKNKGDSNFKYTDSFKSNKYTVKMNDSRNGRQIYCIITDKYGNSVKTNTVTLTLK